MMGKDLKGKEIGVGLSQLKDGKYSGRFVNRFGKRREIRSNDLKELKSWGTIMKATSRCGLGKTASNSIIQSLDKFNDYFNARFA